MTDIVDKLREAWRAPFKEKYRGLFIQAAQEIEHLRAADAAAEKDLSWKLEADALSVDVVRLEAEVERLRSPAATPPNIKADWTMNEEIKPEAKRPPWECAARKQGTAGGNDPADCDWPCCGCDTYANKVMAALDEVGFELIKKRPEPAATPTRLAAIEECAKIVDGYGASVDFIAESIRALVSRPQRATTENVEENK